MDALIADLRPYQVDGPVEGMSGEFHTLTAHPAINKKWDWTVMGTGIVVGGVLAVLLALVGVAALIVMKLTPPEVQVDQPPPPAQIAPAPPPTLPPAVPAIEKKEADPVEMAPNRGPRRAAPKAKPKRRPKLTPKPAVEPRKRRTSDLRNPWDE
jgi:hypothetical protein